MLKNLRKLKEDISKIQTIMIKVSTGRGDIDESEEQYRKLYFSIKDQLRNFKENGIQLYNYDLNVYSSLWEYYSYWKTELKTYRERRDYIRSLYKNLDDTVTQALMRISDKTVKSNNINKILLGVIEDSTKIEDKVTKKQLSDLSKIIFCCYAKEDENIVANIYENLKQDGYSPWMASKNIPAGSHWPTKINQAIRNCELFLAFFSKISVKKTGYVQKELREALEILSLKPYDELFLIPVRLEEVMVPDLSVGSIKLREYQRVDYYTSIGYRQLCSSIDLKNQL